MPPDVCIQLGERIRELRKKRGWRQIDLAEQAGIHEVHISDLERGTREVGLRHLAALAAAFDLSLSEFLKGVNGR
ncbi:MAG: helix-turn-helix transcriptional regulator [Acidobacteriaceae bacterium]|nr:helix-turn-helix transcriptional regulator [Acidobacteriaceae bacterium]